MAISAEMIAARRARWARTALAAILAVLGLAMVGSSGSGAGTVAGVAVTASAVIWGTWRVLGKLPHAAARLLARAAVQPGVWLRWGDRNFRPLLLLCLLAIAVAIWAASRRPRYVRVDAGPGYFCVLNQSSGKLVCKDKDGYVRLDMARGRRLP